MPTIRTVDQIKSNLLRPALTSHFDVQIPLPGANSPGKTDEFRNFLKPNGIDLSGLQQDKLNLMCSEATLPGSSLATLELTNDFHGVTERHVHRRVYDDRIDLTFYVDVENYLPIRFFETWMKWCVDESMTRRENVGSEDMEYFYRIRYRDDYIAPRGLKVIKFEKDYRSFLEYEFIGSFPISITSMPVSYESSSLLKCTVSMSYIRYVLKQTKVSDQSIPSSVNPDQQSIFNNAQFNTSDLTLPGLSGLGALSTGGVSQQTANTSGNTIDRRVEAGLPYVGRNIGPIERFSGI